jgi:hypothetical protein
MRKTIATADIVRTPKGPITVFNIGGNKYRLLCAIHFNRKIFFSRKIALGGARKRENRDAHRPMLVPCKSASSEEVI